MKIGAAPPLQKSRRNHVLVCEQKPYAVWFSCRRMRRYRQPISFPGAYTISCGERNAKKKVLSTTYHTISTRVRVLLYAVALHCGTRYLTAVLAHPTAQVPRSGGERFRGARFDPWAILAYWCTLLQALLDRAIALRLC